MESTNSTIKYLLTNNFNYKKYRQLYLSHSHLALVARYLNLSKREVIDILKQADWCLIKVYSCICFKFYFIIIF